MNEIEEMSKMIDSAQETINKIKATLDRLEKDSDVYQQPHEEINIWN